MLKQIHTHLYLPEGPHWHGDIKKHWHSSGVFIVNFDKIQHLFLVFHCWILGGGGRHCQLHLPVSKPIYIKFKSIQSVGFEETSTNFIGTYSKNIGRIVNIEKNVQFDIYAITSNLFRDCQLITFVMLNRFCPLSKKTTNHSVLNRQYQDEWNTNKNGYKFLYCISSFEGTSYK